MLNDTHNELNIHELVDIYGNALYKYCFHMLRHKEEAEDAVQEVFLNAHNRINAGINLNSISAWLYKLAYNHCLNVIKRKRLLTFIPFVEQISNVDNECESSIMEEHFSEEIERALLLLTPKERTVLLLRTVEDKTYEEIGLILSIRPDAARKQLERAKRKISKLLCNNREVYINEKISVI